MAGISSHKSKIKREERRERLLEEIPRKPYSFYEFCNIGEESNYKKLTNMLIETAEMLIEDIDEILCEKKEQIREFTIGKTYAPRKKKQVQQWRVDGIRRRWNDYQQEGYDFLLAFAVLTKENVSHKTETPFNNQEMLALGIENQIIQHFAFVKHDPRLGNKSLHPGKKSNKGYAGQVIYLAVRYSANSDDEEESSEESE